MKRVDVIVVGGGAAGLLAAGEAARAGRSVVVLTKGQTGRSGATATITGDISVDGRTISQKLGLAGSEADSEEIFFEDTLRGGGDLNDRGLAQSMIENIGEEVKILLDAGLKVAGIGHAPGHRHPRGVLVSGMQVLQILSRQAMDAGVLFRDEFYVTHVVGTRESGVAGVMGIDLRSGNIVGIEASAVILATGAGQMVYAVRTAPEELVGDGYKLALNAGAELVDMEMVQFLPCCLVDPPLWRGVQFPWIIGPQSGVRAWLLNRYGERFMERYDPARMEMSTRDIISLASVREVLEGRGSPGGGVYMSWAHLPREILGNLPTWYGKPLLRSNWRWEGFDFAPLVESIMQGHAVEVAPACHFQMGGVRVNADYETAVPGLLACGEVAGGLHGANRLSGNACSQFLVQGRLAGRSAARHAASGGRSMTAAEQEAVRADLAGDGVPTSALAPHEVLEKVQEITTRALNVVRVGKDLTWAVKQLRDLRKQAGNPGIGGGAAATGAYNRRSIDTLEASSAILTAETIALAALKRTESRGAHYRTDYPDRDDAQRHNGVLAMAGGELDYRIAPIPGSDAEEARTCA